MALANSFTYISILVHILRTPLQSAAIARVLRRHGVCTTKKGPPGQVCGARHSSSPPKHSKLKRLSSVRHRSRSFSHQSSGVSPYRTLIPMRILYFVEKGRCQELLHLQQSQAGADRHLHTKASSPIFMRTDPPTWRLTLPSAYRSSSHHRILHVGGQAQAFEAIAAPQRALHFTMTEEEIY